MKGTKFLFCKRRILVTLGSVKAVCIVYCISFLWQQNHLIYQLFIYMTWTTLHQNIPKRIYKSPSQFEWLEPESKYFLGLKSSPLLPIPGLSSTRTTFFNLSNFSRMKYLSFLCAKERVFISILQYIHFLSLIWLLFSGYLWKCRNIGLTSLPTLIFDMLNNSICKTKIQTKFWFYSLPYTALYLHRVL